MSKFQNQQQYQVLLMSSCLPRECGLATFSHDLRESILEKFSGSCHIDFCALDYSFSDLVYHEPVTHILKVDQLDAYHELAKKLNQEKRYDVILIEHEFGLFGGDYGSHLLEFLKKVKIPVIITFHTILPRPDAQRFKIVNELIRRSKYVICLTNASARLLGEHYVCPTAKCQVIQHGIPLIAYKESDELKAKLALGLRPVLATFGLLSRGKGIETALYALVNVVADFPNVLYLIIGKTHPEVYKSEGDSYRSYLEELIALLGLTSNVRFVNSFVGKKLLEDYLQATDIYLFTSTDPNQAVSGTFAYAMACGCPIVSTAIPQAMDSLGPAGIVIDFNDSKQMALAITEILSAPERLSQMKQAALQQIRPSAWQNVAIQHMMLIERCDLRKVKALHFSLPAYNLGHFHGCTTPVGMIQFCQAEAPQLSSGYTLDDNARALIALLEYYELKSDNNVLPNIKIYFEFIQRMQQANGRFYNYLDADKKICTQNHVENLDDANGRAIWALGTMMALHHLFNPSYFQIIQRMLRKSIDALEHMYSPRAIAFSIKGLVKYNEVFKDAQINEVLQKLASRLAASYRLHHTAAHPWFETKITYGNAVLPEALLLVAQIDGNRNFQQIAMKSFHYLCDLHFENNHFTVISNQTWYEPGMQIATTGEQPIDVAYTILALSTFYELTGNNHYLLQMKKAFDWYLGKNQLSQIVYNPVSGGCLDGIEANEVNINQGAEATTTYLMARNRIEYHLNQKRVEYMPTSLSLQTYPIVLVS
jgi:glycosyltransferase involved in cell wall biosynthesis